MVEKQPDGTEYSGAHPDDPRDPQPVGEIIPAVLTELERYDKDSALFTARQNFIDLNNRTARGEKVDPAELEAAKSALLVEEARVRKLRTDE